MVMKVFVVKDGPGSYDWRPTFIWLPWCVSITNQPLFFQRVFKRRVWKACALHMWRETQYATLFEIMSNVDVVAPYGIV